MECGQRCGTMARRCIIVIGMAVVSALQSGCGNYESLRARPAFQEAALLFDRGSHEASLERYQQIIMQYPSQEDRALFEMGIIHAHAKSGRNYRKSLECFERIVASHPLSGYRQDSEMMSFYIENVARKDEVIAIQQGRIESLRRELVNRANEVAVLHELIVGLEKKAFSVVLQYGAADKILIEKRARRLMLMFKGEVLKSYRVALGSEPSGPKERLGDNRTPEGIYRIDAKNRDSSYHISLHISYPNDADKRRAKEMGVEPGGNIMIHGVKKGLSPVGHVMRDWTQGCIAVTDEEIEEIDRLTPIGTVVEITP